MTAIPTLALFWSVFKKRVFVFYLVVCLSGTLLIAYGSQLLVFVPGVDTGNALFRGVGALSGGPSAIIEKKSAKIHIVLDANDRKTIAVADSDPVIGQGSIVFDSGINRLKDISKLDNLKYWGNTADWLEQGSSGTMPKTILIYDTGFGNGGSPTRLGDQLPAMLQHRGFTVKVTDRRQTPRLSGDLLSGYNQIWIIFDESTIGSRLVENELEAVSSFNNTGNGLLLMAGTGEGLKHDMAAANALSSKYGVIFSQYGENHEMIKISYAAEFFTSASDFIGRVLKIFHKA